MMQKRQNTLTINFNAKTPALARAENYLNGTRIPWHTHDLAQLIHATEGVMTVETDDGLWVVPPGRAVWVPAFEAHCIRMTGAVTLRSLYLDPRLTPFANERCCVVQVSALLKAAILRTIKFKQPYAEGSCEARLVAVMLDEIRAAPTAPLHLPSLKDPRAQRVAEEFQINLSDRRSISAWAQFTGASTRTLERLFRDDTGMTFGAWQRQVYLLRSLEALASGQSVTAAALEVGFENPSAFIAMFRRALGVTPAKYFRGREDDPATSA
mgnify:CR=1 FL=1